MKKKTLKKDRSTKARTAIAPSPESQLQAFIDKFDPKIAQLIRDARAVMRKRLPAAQELVYDNYNFFVIGYSATERPSDGIASLAASAKGVALSFYRGSSLPDPDGILLGGGNQNRFVRLPTAATLAEPAVQRLIRAAVEQTKSPLPKAARGRTIIRSVSTKQRPRSTAGADKAGISQGRV